MNALTKTFYIDVTSEMDERRYSGTFTTKKLTMGDLSMMGMRKAQMSAGFSHNPDNGSGVDMATNLINEMIVHCEVALVQKPDWFDPRNLIDMDVLRAVYEEVASFEATFLDRKRAAQGQAVTGGSADSGSVEHQGQGGASGSNQDLVDKKVPKVSQL